MSEHSGGVGKVSLTNLFIEEEKRKILDRALNFQFHTTTQDNNLLDSIDENMEFEYSFGGESFMPATTTSNLNRDVSLSPSKRIANHGNSMTITSKKLKNDGFHTIRTDIQKGVVNNNLRNTNRYEILNSKENSESEQNNISTGNHPTNELIKGIQFCPPIFVSGLSIKNVLDSLKKDFGDKIKYKFVSLGYNKFELFVNDSEAHNKIMDMFRKAKINSYSSTPKDKNKFTMLLKCIYGEFTANEILNEIKEKAPDVKIAKTTPFSTSFSRKSNRKLNMFLVQLDPEEKVDKLLNIKQLLYQRIHWEKIYKTDIVRCYRCRWFGHTGQYCSFAVKCVICGEEHELSSCPRIGNNNKSEAKCINCGENHTASYKGCKKYVEYKQRKEILTERIRQTAENRRKFIQGSV